MAQHIQIDLIDDITGEEAQDTVAFSLDGTDYDIDLTVQNAEKLRSLLTPYVAKGRKVDANPRNTNSRKTASVSTSRSKREEARKIRHWAQANGYNFNTRGRIPQTIIDAYNNH